MTGQNGVHL